MRFLQQRGLRVMLRNFRTKFGEIDLVMEDGDTIAIVEVRYRRSASHGSPAATVDRRKQSRLAIATEILLKTRSELASRPLRFDVVAIAGDPRASGSIRWIRDAFRPGDA